MASISGFLRKSFPFINAAASLGGPLGSLAAQAVGKALGIGEDKPLSPDLDSLTKSIAGATPDQLIELRKAEMELQARLAELGYSDVEELEALAEQDRASARAREIAVKDWTPKTLAFLVVFMVMLGEGYILVHGLSATSDLALVGRILGTLDSGLMLILSYYFGSSAGSERKTEIMAKEGK